MAEIQVQTKVEKWSDAEGWGALAATDLTPGGAFVHFTAIEMEGFRTLRVGQEVEALVEGPLDFEQDGYRYIAKMVRPVA